MAIFGWNVQGGLTYGSIANFLRACRFTLAVDGDITSLHVYLQKGAVANFDVKGNIYSNNGANDDPLSPVCPSAERNFDSPIDGWFQFNVAPPVRLAAGVYHIVFWHEQTINMFYQAGAVGQYHSDGQAYDGWPDPFGVAGTLDREFSFFATYTPVTVPASRRLMVGAGI